MHGASMLTDEALLSATDRNSQPTARPAKSFARICLRTICAWF